MATECILKCVRNVFPSIKLSNLEKIIVGRSPDTKIKDKRCSKRQVEFIADYMAYSVKVMQIGANSCGYKNKPLTFEQEVTLQHDDVFELLFGEHQYKVLFTPPPSEGFYSKKRKADISNFFTTKFARARSQDKWEAYENDDLLMLNCGQIPNSRKIASYDMDGTLIATASGNVFPKDENDWKIIFPEVPGKLKKLQEEGYKIVIFTNQAGIAIGKNSVEGIQKKISQVVNKLGIEAQALISTGKTKYRKPIPNMWDFFIKKCNEGVEAEMSCSFYVGDAAGRPEIKKFRKKDHSCADRLFALNIGLPFFTPEEHFLGHKKGAFKMPDFIPNSVFNDSIPLLDPPSSTLANDYQEVILLVGYPGCGKSHFTKTYLLKNKYIQINRDTLGSWQKCVSVLGNALQVRSSMKPTKHQGGESVAIDNTNPDEESRKRYVDVAKRSAVPIRCFVFDITIEHAKHNNKFRELSGSDHSKVNDMIYNMYKSKYVEPTLQEGFSEIVKVNFKPRFQNKDSEQMYQMFLLEK